MKDPMPQGTYLVVVKLGEGMTSEVGLGDIFEIEKVWRAEAKTTYILAPVNPSDSRRQAFSHHKTTDQLCPVSRSTLKAALPTNLLPKIRN